jgi:3-oxoadipate enol-lactonase
MRIQANGIEMGYRIDGPEGAPAVVFSHSLAASREMWEPQLPALSDRYQVLRYDLRGHGESAVGETPYTPVLLASDVAALLAALDISRAHFVGLSIGGVIGQALALARSDLLLTLTLCDTLARAPEGFGAVWEERVRSAQADGMAALVEPTIERWFTPPFFAAAPEIVDRVRAMIAATQPAAYAGCAAALSTLDLMDRLGEIALPTLVVVGADDQSTPVAMAESIQAAIPGARLQVLENAAHLSNIEQKDRFNAALSDFLDGI